MKHLITATVLSLISFTPLKSQNPTAKDVIERVEQNMSSENRITSSEMIIYGKRKTRTIVSKGYSEGNEKSFTEYLAPAREKGVKMLKLGEKLWIYSPHTDRTIQLSGHMLRQSVMGSDLSYEDMMENRELTDLYTITIIATETFDNRTCWKLELIAKVNDVAYYKRIMWVDQERYVPLKEELFAKSGQLLKRTTLSDIKQIQGRWFPTKMNYKDMLKTGKGTDFIITDISFNNKIPPHIFTKSALIK